MNASRALPVCRFCAAPLENIFADLGETPLANRNLQPDEIASEKKYPLIARVCSECLLVQVDDSVPPEDIFSDYDYFSSASDGWVAHAKAYSDAMIKRFALGPQSLVVEVASNDGYLLQHFIKSGLSALGVEPAANVAKAAIAKGVPTEVAFFGVETGKRLAARGKKADLMAANNVLAHVPDTRDFVGGFAQMLAPEGVATFEFPHVMNLIEQVQFDTIYHEHFFYLSLFAVEKIMASADLRVFDVEELPTHGGSLRLFVCHRDAAHFETAEIAALRRREHACKLDTLAGYEGFPAEIARVKQSFLEFVEQAASEGKSIAGYGAAAKGSTFLNFCGVDKTSIREVYDRAPSKQGKLTPGTHIPILPPEEITARKPNYVVILPWNIAAEVKSRMSVIESWGGRFVTAVPRTKIL
jgi:SAM-dependent methyltransferase